MAKDLPYFKFFCSEWNDGDVTLESYEAQGLFINICSYYWSNECEVSIDKLNKKFRGQDKTLDVLLNASLFKIDNDMFVRINFLDEQKQERNTKSLINSKNGSKGGRPKKQKETENKPNALNSLSETKGIKRREEKKREEKILLPLSTTKDKIDFKILLSFINKQTKREFKVINDSVKNKFKARLKEGYSKEDISNTVINSCKDPFHKEHNFKYLTPEYFSRSATMDKFSAKVVKDKAVTFKNPYPEHNHKS